MNVVKIKYLFEGVVSEGCVALFYGANFSLE